MELIEDCFLFLNIVTLHIILLCEEANGVSHPNSCKSRPELWTHRNFLISPPKRAKGTTRLYKKLMNLHDLPNPAQ